MLLSLCGRGGGWGWWCGWGLQSHFRVQPNNCLEVVLRCVVVGVGVVTTRIPVDNDVDIILDLEILLCENM